MGLEQELDFVHFHCPPVDILESLLFDKNGLYVNRVCPVIAGSG